VQLLIDKSPKNGNQIKWRRQKE